MDAEYKYAGISVYNGRGCQFQGFLTVATQKPGGEDPVIPERPDDIPEALENLKWWYNDFNNIQFKWEE